MHVTVTGMGRGGTSIAGQVLSKHPKVEFRHERANLWLASALKFPQHGRLEPSAATAEVRRGYANWAQPRESGKLLVEKDPRHVMRLGFARRCWPDARIVYLLRDPRDLCCSALKGIAKKGRTLDEWLRQRVGDGFAREHANGLPPLLVLLTWWNYAVSIDLGEMRGDPLFRVVRYEDLIRYPAAQFASILHWAGLEVVPQISGFLAKVSDDPKVHVSPLSAGLFVPGHSRRIGRWLDEWPADQAEQAKEVAGPLLEQWGYM